MIDNTEWPQALGYNEWIGPEQHSEDEQKTLFLEMHVNSYFSATDVHQATVKLFSTILLWQIFFLVIVGASYITLSQKYDKMEIRAKE